MIVTNFFSQDGKMRQKYCIYFPYLLMFIAFLIAHLLMKPNYNDDKVIMDAISPLSLKETLIYQYEQGQSLFCRYWHYVIIGFVLKFGNGILWRPLLAGCYTVIAICIFRLFSDQKQKTSVLLSCLVILLFPIRRMGETGWVSTSMVYITPITFALIGCVGMKKLINNEYIKIYEYPLYFISVYLGTAHEQLAPFLMVIFLIICLRSFYVKKIKKFQLVLIGVSIYQCYRALTWPGNSGRIIREAKVFFPDYFSLNIIDKIYLAYHETMRRMLKEFWLPLTVLTILLCIVIFYKYKLKWFRFLGGFPVIITLATGILSPFMGYWPGFGKLFDSSSLLSLNNVSNKLSFLTILLGIVYLGNIVINIYLVMGDSVETLLYQLIFMGGMCTRVIMGFSASLYASDARTFAVFFLCIIILIYVMLEKLLKIKPQMSAFAQYGMSILGGLGYLDLLCNI